MPARPCASWRAACVAPPSSSPATSVSGTASHRARHLEAAATELAAGRDLLHTHLAIDPDGLTLERSEWASAVTSVPVTRALANEAGQWSLRLAPFTAWLADSAAAYARPDGPGQTLSVSVRTEFATASQWLQAAGAAVHLALRSDPVRPADAELLCAIPAAMVPRRPVSDGESVAELCDGITISASRLRGAMRDSKDRARWSPSVTSGGWQWMAQAGAVTSHLSELALGALATRAGQLPGSPASEARLRDVAEFMVGMRAAWHQVDRMWDVMITESRMLPTQAMTDASDLVLRMGRLVWDDPHWTPAHSRRAPLRNPAALAPETGVVTTVIAAVHQSVDALARLAKAEMNAVGAARPGRAALRANTVAARGVRRTSPFRDRSRLPMPGAARGIPCCPGRQRPGRASARRAFHRGRRPEQGAGARASGGISSVQRARQPTPAR